MNCISNEKIHVIVGRQAAADKDFLSDIHQSLSQLIGAHLDDATYMPDPDNGQRVTEVIVETDVDEKVDEYIVSVNHEIVFTADGVPNDLRISGKVEQSFDCVSPDNIEYRILLLASRVQLLRNDAALHIAQSTIAASAMPLIPYYLECMARLHPRN